MGILRARVDGAWVDVGGAEVEQAWPAFSWQYQHGDSVWMQPNTWGYDLFSVNHSVPLGHAVLCEAHFTVYCPQSGAGVHTAYFKFLYDNSVQLALTSNTSGGYNYSHPMNLYAIYRPIVSGPHRYHFQMTADSCFISTSGHNAGNPAWFRVIDIGPGY